MADGENGVSGCRDWLGSALSGVAKLTRNAELPGFLPRRTENATNARLLGCGDSLERTPLQSRARIFPAYQSGPESALRRPGIRENYWESFLRIEFLADKRPKKSFSF